MIVSVLSDLHHPVEFPKRFYWFANADASANANANAYVDANVNANADAGYRRLDRKAAEVFNDR